MAVLSQEDLQSAKDIILAAIKDQFPKIETRPGSVMRELVVAAGAIGFAVINQRLEDFKKSQSLKDLAENPDLVDDSVIDAILSNYFATRKPGSKARGKVKVVVATRKLYFLPAGTSFTTSDDLTYISTADALVEPAPKSSTSSLDLLEDEGGDAFFFLLDVEAVEEGAAFSISQGTQLDTTVLGSELIVATSFTDFSEGADEETTDALVKRVGELITVRDLISPKAIKAVLTESFDFVKDIAVVRYGSREMIRDRYSITGFGVGGKADIYLRTSLGPEVTVIQKTVDANGEIVLSEAETEIPFYKIERIARTTLPDGSLEFSVEFDFDKSRTENELNNDLKNARFSIYERATITLADTSVFGKDVFISIVKPTGVSEIQTYLLDEDNRVVAADYLAKAIVPCFVTVKAKYSKSKLVETLNLSNVKLSIFNYINTLKAGEKLYASKLVDILHNFNIQRVSLPIELSGEIHRPDGTIEEITSTDALGVPDRFSLGMSQNNTAYFIFMNKIELTEIS